MNWFLKCFLTFWLSLFIAGCGSGGSTAIGTTVAVTPGITTGTAGSVFANISSVPGVGNVLSSNPMSVTLTSVATSSNNTVPVSPVNINRIAMTLTPLAYSSIPANSTNELSPIISSPQYSNILQGVGGVIPGPGTLKIDGINVLGISDGAILLNAFALSGKTQIQYHYIANLSFYCVEAYTGTQFTVSLPVGVEARL